MFLVHSEMNFTAFNIVIHKKLKTLDVFYRPFVFAVDCDSHEVFVSKLYTYIFRFDGFIIFINEIQSHDMK